MGETFSSAGDFNKDSYPDVIVGAPGSNFLESAGNSPFENGLAYILLGSATGFSNENNITLSDNVANSGFALSLGGTGDINNDGFDDVVVGANKYEDYLGRIYVYLGNDQSTQNPEADLIINGNSSQTKFGEFTKIISDINNDGFDEIAVRTSIITDNPDFPEPVINIYFGKADISSLEEPDLVLVSDDEKDDFGWSFNSIGDINGDSYSDLLSELLD
ncbi:MAG: integrin alpha [Candidatus Hodarchaeales archaeon]